MPKPKQYFPKHPVKFEATPGNNCILVGRGVFGWFLEERRSNRYGSCFVEGDMWFPVHGKAGRLVALVTDPKRSTHIGDIDRDICPSKPKHGDRYLLGEGTAFVEPPPNGGTCYAFGVKPTDERCVDWLNPYNLYRCHTSVVELHWYPAQ